MVPGWADQIAKSALASAGSPFLYETAASLGGQMATMGSYWRHDPNFQAHVNWVVLGVQEETKEACRKLLLLDAHPSSPQWLTRYAWQVGIVRSCNES